MGTSIKKTFWISATPVADPANATLADYQALTWIKVTGIESVGAIGFSHATVDSPDLESGITKKLKGARSGQDASSAYRTVANDPGQAAVEAANEAVGEVSIYVLNPAGTIADFWTGIIHSHMEREASTTTVEGSTFSFAPNYPKVTGAPS